MKKVLCILLSCAMLLGICAPMALAVKEAPVSMDGPEIIFFETDFEKDDVGKKPKNFSTVVASATSLVDVYEEDGNKAARFYRSPEASGAGGPRLDQRVTVRGLKAFSVEYDVKWTAGESTFGVGSINNNDANGKTHFINYEYTFNADYLDALEEIVADEEAVSVTVNTITDYVVGANGEKISTHDYDFTSALCQNISIEIYSGEELVKKVVTANETFKLFHADFSFKNSFDGTVNPSGCKPKAILLELPIGW